MTANNGVLSVRIYEAQGKPLNLFRSMQIAMCELYQARFVVWHLFVRDFLAGLRQRLLGYLWIVLLPLVSMASFVFMQKSGVLNPGTTVIPYPIYVYMGMSIWGLFVNSATVVGNGLVTNNDLVVRTNIPKIALVVMGLATIYYNLLINLLVLIAFLFLFDYPPTLWAFAYPIITLPIIFLGMGIGLALSVVGAVMRDAVTIFTTIINLVMYITPVAYTAQFSQPLFKALVQWNPLSYLVDEPRNLFFLGKLIHLQPFLYSILFSFFILVLGVHIFYSVKDKVTERL